MTKNEYKSWITELKESENKDLQEIGNKAAQSARVLDLVIRCSDHSHDAINNAIIAETGEDIEYNFDVDDVNGFNKLVSDGWISFHGEYIATWSDCILD